MVQSRAETERVGWRYQIESQLGIRYSYWRDAAYRLFPPDWMKRPSPSGAGLTPEEGGTTPGPPMPDRQLGLWERGRAHGPQAG